MPLDQWSPEQISAFAGVATAIVAVSALLVATIQIQAMRRATRTTLALESHRQYIQLSIEYPQYSSSNAALKTLNLESWKGVLAKADSALTVDAEVERYLWMVSFVLNNCEQILAYAPRSNCWRLAIKAHLSYHLGVLEEVWSEWKSHYADATQALVGEVLAEHARNAK